MLALSRRKAHSLLPSERCAAASKKALAASYGMKDQELDRIQSAAAEKAERLKTKIPRELDLNYLNHERFGRQTGPQSDQYPH
jgi:hypothetical protein